MVSGDHDQTARIRATIEAYFEGSNSAICPSDRTNSVSRSTPTLALEGERIAVTEFVLPQARRESSAGSLRARCAPGADRVLHCSRPARQRCGRRRKMAPSSLNGFYF